VTRIVCYLLFSSLLVSCGDRPDAYEALWQRYTQSLSRTLDRQAPVPAPAALPALPSAAAITFPVDSEQINLLEFLRLRRCALGQTLAEKNSILGRHGDNASALLFALRFLDEVDACIEILDDSEAELKASLLSAKRQKRKQLPALIFNALIAGPEFRELWQAPAQHRQPYPPEQRDVAVTALAHWRVLQQQWLAGLDYHRYRELIPILADIRRGLGGEWLRFQRQSNSGLKQANALLEQRLNGRQLCLTGSANENARIFAQVLHKLFIAGIQAEASLANRHQQALLTELEGLSGELAVQLALPSAYQAWQKQLTERGEQFLKAFQRHVQLSGELLEQCGLSPSSTQDSR
tara:strand:+ start:27524 stop:28573 length:1050 start_codon:yes stop_codon:yes gene_type:complete